MSRISFSLITFLLIIAAIVTVLMAASTVLVRTIEKVVVYGVAGGVAVMAIVMIAVLIITWKDLD